MHCNLNQYNRNTTGFWQAKAAAAAEKEGDGAGGPGSDQDLAGGEV